jgi:hypothetical protein
VDDDDKKPAAIIFATAGNVTHPLITTTGNETQSLAATTGMVTQSLTGNETQSLSETPPSHPQRRPAMSTLAATGSMGHSPTFTQALASTTCNETQSLVATGSNIAQLLTVMAINVAQSLTALASNVTQPTLAATGSLTHSPTFTQANIEAELASFSPEMIAEDAAARELLLERHP